MFQWNIQATLPKSLCFISHFQSQRSYETPPINDFLGIPYSVGHCTKSTWSFQSTSSKQHPWSLLPSFRVCSGCRPVSLTLFPRSGLLVHAGDRTSSGASWDPAPVWLSLCCLKLFFLERLCAQQCAVYSRGGCSSGFAFTNVGAMQGAHWVLQLLPSGPHHWAWDMSYRQNFTVLPSHLDKKACTKKIWRISVC